MEGLRIPEDMSIIGFDGVEEAEYYNPALDTIMQPAQQMAQQTVRCTDGDAARADRAAISC